MLNIGVECPSNSSDETRQYEAKSMLQIIFSQFLEHRFAVISSFVILFFIIVALSAPLISQLTGLHPYSQNMFNRYKPPMSRIPYTTDRMEEILEGLIEKDTAYVSNLKTGLKSQSAVNLDDVDFDLEGVSFLLELMDLINSNEEFKSQLFLSANPVIQNFLKKSQNLTTLHIFGTDELGRDVLIRLIYGARVSIGVGLLVAFSGAIIGLLFGSVAGFYGGFVDAALMRITDAMLSLPLLPVLIVCAAVDLKKIPVLEFIFDVKSETIFKLVFILAAFSWMTVARLVRGSILSLKEQDFIHAARTLGAKSGFIIRTHLLPNVIAPLLVSVTVNIGMSILLEAYLSFLGLGIQPPMPSWGNMLQNAIELVYEAPILAILPGLMIFIIVISFNFLGDGLQDAVDPKAIRR